MSLVVFLKKVHSIYFAIEAKRTVPVLLINMDKPPEISMNPAITLTEESKRLRLDHTQAAV